MHGAGARLIDMVAAPHALIESHGRLRLNANYYITKQVQLAISSSASILQVCSGLGSPLYYSASTIAPVSTVVVLKYFHLFFSELFDRTCKALQHALHHVAWNSRPEVRSFYSHTQRLPLERHIRVLLL